MKPWANQQLTSFREVLSRFRTRPVVAILNASVIGIALSLPAVLYVILDNLQGTSRQMSREPQLSVFMAMDAAQSDVAKTNQALEKLGDAGSFHFVPKDKALEELKAGSNLGDVLGELGENPLPDAFVITAKDHNPKTLERIRLAVSAWPKVQHVQADAEWARKLYAVLRVGKALVAVLALLLSGAVIAVTFNTIRLQILTRQEEIEVTRLIGATHGYILRPFLYAGAVQGLAGAVVACLLVLLIAAWLNYHLSDLAVFYSGQFQLKGLSVWDAGSLLVAASLLGLLGAWLSVSRHLWRLEY
ncbi:MAG: FtsX-like permease family protein [Betaproteobacteria bacterium]|nr:FtsX-like permease family protein [Betaproteobacteria bacterium]